MREIDFNIKEEDILLWYNGPQLFFLTIDGQRYLVVASYEDAISLTYAAMPAIVGDDDDLHLAFKDAVEKRYLHDIMDGLGTVLMTATPSFPDAHIPSPGATLRDFLKGTST